MAYHEFVNGQKRSRARSLWKHTHMECVLDVHLYVAVQVQFALTRAKAIHCQRAHSDEWYSQSWQPGLCACKYLIEWVAGGWSLTFVSKQAESHWNCATQTCLSSLLSPLSSLHPQYLWILLSPCHVLPSNSWHFNYTGPSFGWKFGSQIRLQIRLEIRVANPGRTSGSPTLVILITRTSSRVATSGRFAFSLEICFRSVSKLSRFYM